MKKVMGKLTAFCLAFFLVFSIVSPVQAVLFNDTHGHWADKDILKLASEGLLYGDKSGQFYPDAFVSRQEVAALFVRLINKEDIAKSFEDDANYKTPRGASAWAKNYILAAEKEGIIDESSLQALDWSAAASREEVAMWLCRSISLLPVVADKGLVLGRFVDANEIDQFKAPYIVPLVQANIMVGSNGYFHPHQPVRRAEVAAMMNRVDEKYLARDIVRSQKGQIVSFAAWPYKSMTVKKSDGQFMTLANADDTAIFKNEKHVSMDDLKVGEEVIYVADSKCRLLFAESTAYNSSSVWYNGGAGSNVGIPINPGTNTGTAINPGTGSSAGYYPGGVYELRRGKIMRIDWQANTLDVEVNGRQERFSLKNALRYMDGCTYYGNVALRIGYQVELIMDNGCIDGISVLSDSYGSGSEENIRVYKAKLDEVDERDDEIELKSVYYWSGSSWKSKSLSRIDLDNRVDIYDYDGDSIDRDDLEDYENDTVYMLYDDDEDELLQIRIKKGSEYTYHGDLDDLNTRKDSFELNSKDIDFDDDTMVLAGSDLYDVDDLEEDDELRVVVNKYNNHYYAVLIELEDIHSSSSRDSDYDDCKIYYGKLDDYDSRDDELEFSSTLRYWNGSRWSTSNDSKTMDVDSGADVYDYDGDEMHLSDLRDHEGEYIYALYDEYNDEIVKVRIKKGTASTKTDDIEYLSSNRDRFKLNGQYIYYDEGSIVVKDDEIFDEDDLEEDLDVRAVVNYYSGKYYLVLIELDEESSSSNDYEGDCEIYRAELDNVDDSEEEITVERSTIEYFSDGSWHSASWDRTMSVDHADIYHGSSRIDVERLDDDYEGEQIYFAVEDYDEDQIIKLVVVDEDDIYAFPSVYIDDLDDDRESFELSGSSYDDDFFYYGNYTLIVDDDGSLMDTDEVSEERVNIVAEKTSSDSYRVLVIEED